MTNSERKEQFRIHKHRYQLWRNRSEGRSYLCILFSMCEGKCPKCQQRMILYFGDSPRGSGRCEKNRATLDHIIPLSKTLKHDKLNLAICCYACNQEKADEEESWSAGKVGIKKVVTLLNQ